MIVEAERLGCVREVIVIAAALSLQDPRERPEEHRAHADQLHARFKDETSDFLTWLNLWRHLKEQQKELGSSAFRRMCKREFLNYLRVREWQDFESQLRQVCKEMRIEIGPPVDIADAADADGIHQALLSGLLSHIGLLEEREKETTGGVAAVRCVSTSAPAARGSRSSRAAALAKKPPQFLMAGELVETSRLWARQNAAIKPEWAEELAGDLAKKTYSEPHWSKKRAAVMAYERVTLYGVTLVADRLTPYSKVDPALSRELFIRHALVYGEWHTHQRFYRKNLELLEQAEELEHRARRRGIVVDEHTLFDFYDARIGPEVVSGVHFDTWWKDRRRTDPELLTFDPAMLTHAAADEVRAEDYPEVWRSGVPTDGLTFPVSYHFEPGAAEDGLTIEVPVATLNRVSDDDFSWNVPGLREELVTALIRSLPKNLRVSFVPAPDRARAFLASVPAGDEPLLDALERWARSTTGVVVPREAWDWSKVPEHLRPTFRVVDEGGAEQARGKDLEALKEPLRPQFAEALAEVAADSGLSRSGETTWTFGDVPESTTSRRAGHDVVVHPALLDEGTHGRARGLRVGRRGGRPAPARRRPPRAAEQPRAPDGSWSTACPTPRSSAWPARRTPRSPTSSRTVASRSSLETRGRARPRCGRRRRTTRCWPRSASGLEDRVRTVLADVLRALEGWREADRALSGRAEMAQLPALTDMKDQLARLVHPGFVGEAGATQLRRYPAYLAALQHRRRRLDDGHRRGQPGPPADGAGDRRRGRLPARGRGAAPTAARRAPPSGASAGCSRSTASPCSRRRSAPPGSVSDQRIRKALAAAT